MRKLWTFAVAFLAAALGGCGGGGAPTFSIAYEAPGGTGLVGGQVAGLPYAPQVQQDLFLAQAVAVLGRVTDGSGAPLVDAEISFSVSASAPAFVSDGANALGDYAVSLGAGTWTARVDSGTKALGRMTVNGLVVAGAGPVTFDFQFPARVAVSGDVLDSLGAAVAEAELDFTGRDTGARVSVAADGAGHYAATLLPDTYEAVVTPAGPAEATHLKQRFTGIVVVGPATRNFTLTRGVQVSGTVFTHVGAPLLAKTRVRVLLPDGSVFFSPPSVQTNESDGTYSIGPVPAGNATFQLRPPDDSGFPLQRVPRTIVGPLAETEDFTLLQGFVLSGVLRRDDGVTPESDVTVQPVPRDGSPSPEDVKSDGSGAYSISLFPGLYDVTFTPKVANRQLPETRPVSVMGATVLDVILTRGALVTGTVLLPGGADPAEDIRVEIPGVLGASDVTDGDGAYSFLAPAGARTLTFTALKGPLVDIALADLGIAVFLPGPVPADVTLSYALTGRTVVAGMVFSPDGVSPVAGADVEAFDATGDRIARAVSGPDGTYTLVIR